MKKKVLYYTTPFFLDISLDVINVLKSAVDLYVFIEITDQSKHATVLNVDSLPENDILVSPEKIMQPTEWKRYQPYLEGVCEVKFVVHKYSFSNMAKLWSVSREVNKKIDQINPDVIHFESYSLRSIGMLKKFASSRKILLAVHDSQLHSGMKNMKIKAPRFAFFQWPGKKTFVFYSSFCKNDFIENVPHRGSSYITLSLKPFSYLRNAAQELPVSDDYILFFGRISKYKGLDIMLDAMPMVWEKNPGVKLMVAGGTSDQALIEHPVLNRVDDRVIFYNRFIPDTELSGIIKKAKFVVCPYRDATQSGVLSTSFGLGKPVIATNTGAFSEQLTDGVNGLLVQKAEPTLFAEAINKALENNLFKKWEENVKNINMQNPWKENGEIILNAYFEK